MLFGINVSFDCINKVFYLCCLSSKISDRFCVSQVSDAAEIAS